MVFEQNYTVPGKSKAQICELLKSYVQHVGPGAFCIDATAGKGRDTALLCRLAGESGHVLAFDIQPDAISQTKALLAAEGLTADCGKTAVFIRPFIPAVSNPVCHH